MPITLLFFVEQSEEQTVRFRRFQCLMNQFEHARHCALVSLSERHISQISGSA